MTDFSLCYYTPDAKKKKKKTGSLMRAASQVSTSQSNYRLVTGEWHRMNMPYKRNVQLADVVPWKWGVYGLTNKLLPFPMFARIWDPCKRAARGVTVHAQFSDRAPYRYNNSKKWRERWACNIRACAPCVRPVLFLSVLPWVKGELADRSGEGD